MILMIRLMTYAYALLVRLYPLSFRAQFEEEMRQVFADAVADVGASPKASLRRSLSLAALWHRELGGALASLPREHWQDLMAKEIPMRATPEVNAVTGEGQAAPVHLAEPASWHDAALAGLPHLLMALILGMPGLLRAYGVLAPYTQGLPASETLFALGLAGAIVLVLITSWRHGWPRWAASWYAYGLGLAALAVVMLLQNGTTPTVLSEASVFVVLPLVLAWLLYGVSRRGRLKGLLAALPVVTVAWHPILEFVPIPTRAWTLLGGWLVTALVAAAIVRLGSVQVGVWLVIGLSILVGLPFSYARTYLHNIPPAHASQPSPWGLTNRFAPQLLASSALVIGPLLGRALRTLGERSGRTGVRSYRLALLGVLLTLMGSLGTFWLTTMSSLWLYHQKGTRLFTVTIFLGVLVYLSGSLSLLVLTRRKGSLLSKATPFLAIIVPLGLPLVIMLNAIPFSTLAGAHPVRSIPKGVVYGAGLAWLSVGGWLVTLSRIGKLPPQAAAG
jgi:hypothetical protein